MSVELYHGSSLEIQNPNFEHSRTDIDFGIGFYLTQDEQMAKKWASAKNKSVINIYKLDFLNLKIGKFNLDKKWLDFVAFNRGFSNVKFNTDNFDVLIGPTADDKLYYTVEKYLNNEIKLNDTLKCLAIANLSTQIVLKTAKALENLKFLRSYELTKSEVKDIRDSVFYERIIIKKQADEILNINQSTKTQTQALNIELPTKQDLLKIFTPPKTHQDIKNNIIKKSDNLKDMGRDR